MGDMADYYAMKEDDCYIPEDEEKERTEMKNIFDIIKPPFHYDDFGQKIFDKDNNLILDIRMWGHLSKYENAAEMQDSFGRMLAETLTNIAQRSK